MDHAELRSFPAARHWQSESPGVPQRPDWPGGELFERRVVFVAGPLDSFLAVRAAAELMTLDASGMDPVDVYLDSRDGTVEAAFVLIDTLDLMVAPTHIHALGEVAGPAVGVLAVGGHRTAAPHAHFRLAEPRLQVSGTSLQLLAQKQQQQLLLQRFRERLARSTGHSVAEVNRDLQEGRYLDPREALTYGLIDEIAGGGSLPNHMRFPELNDADKHKPTSIPESTRRIQ